MHQVRFTDFPVYDRLFDAPVVCIKASIETDLKFYACVFNGLQRCINPVKIIINGFFAKDMFSSVCRFNNDFRMR